MPPFMRFRALFSESCMSSLVHITFSKGCRHRSVFMLRLGTIRLRYLLMHTGSRLLEEVAYRYFSSPCLVCGSWFLWIVLCYIFFKIVEIYVLLVGWRNQLMFFPLLLLSRCPRSISPEVCRRFGEISQLLATLRRRRTPRVESLLSGTISAGIKKGKVPSHLLQYLVLLI